MKNYLLVLICLVSISFPSFSQSSESLKNTVQFIDSLTKSNNIERCSVYTGEIQWGDKKHKFSFLNNMLVLDLQGKWRSKKAYYIMDKLVSFYLEEDKIVFHFQN